MKQQIFVIHGGSAYPTYEAYLEALRKKEVTLEGLVSKEWKSLLQQKLGDGYVVYQPTMPNRKNAKYLEWKIWFEKYIPFLEEGIIFVGHSLGGIFLAKYLSEEAFPKKIRATFLVAAPLNRGEEPMADFVLPDSLEKLGEQAGKLVFFHSKDDSIVPFEHVEKYREELAMAYFMLFEDRGHFNDEDFFEMTEEIRKLH